MMTDPDPDRLPQALTALRAGAVTMTEAARYVGVTRQAMLKRLRKLKLDPHERREAYLKQLWEILDHDP